MNPYLKNLGKDSYDVGNKLGGFFIHQLMKVPKRKEAKPKALKKVRNKYLW